MGPPQKQPDPEVPQPWRPRFGIRTMLLVMLVACVTASSGFYLVRSLDERGRSAHLVFLLFTLAAPMLLVVVLSAIRRIAVRRKRR